MTIAINTRAHSHMNLRLYAAVIPSSLRIARTVYAYSRSRYNKTTGYFDRKAVRRYIYENQGLMRRMYGEQRQGELLTREVAQERKRFDSSVRSGRLLQILNEHEIQDLQNLEELRTLAQRVGRFGDHENLIQGQQGIAEPRRSVRFNSRYTTNTRALHNTYERNTY